MTITAPLYDRLGGQPAVRDLTDRLYSRILADPLLAGFFAGTDRTRQAERMCAFLSTATGGPQHYGGRGLRQAHAGLGITDAHFDAVAGHLVAALCDLGASDADIDDAVELAESVRGDIRGVLMTACAMVGMPVRAALAWHSWHGCPTMAGVSHPRLEGAWPLRSDAWG